MAKKSGFEVKILFLKNLKKNQYFAFLKKYFFLPLSLHHLVLPEYEELRTKQKMKSITNKS